MAGTQGSGAWRNYTNGNHVYDLSVEGDYVWAGTGGGVVRWSRADGSHVKYTTADGLASNSVYAIAIDGAGHKWFGTGGGVSEFDGANWITYTTSNSGLADNGVGAIAIDGADHMWFGAWGGGVSEFDGSTWTTYTTADGLAGNLVGAIAIDGADHMWFGTSGGVSEFDGSTWTTYTTADGLASNWVYAIAVDGTDHMWFGTLGGVSEFIPDGVKLAVDPTIGGTLTYTDTQGLPTVIQVPAGAVTELITLLYVPVDTATAPSGFAFAGHAFDLDGYQGGSLLPGLTFSVPATVTLHYAGTDVTGLDEDALVLEYWNGSAWVDAACGDYDRHPGENWLAVPIYHLGRFALFEGTYTVYLPLVLRRSP